MASQCGSFIDDDNQVFNADHNDAKEEMLLIQSEESSCCPWWLGYFTRAYVGFCTQHLDSKEDEANATCCPAQYKIGDEYTQKERDSLNICKGDRCGKTQMCAVHALCCYLPCIVATVADCAIIPMCIATDITKGTAAKCCPPRGGIIDRE